MNRTCIFNSVEMNRKTGELFFTPRKTIWLPQETRNGSMIIIPQTGVNCLEGKTFENDAASLELVTVTASLFTKKTEVI